MKIWQKIIRDFVFILILGGITVGLYFASLIGPTRQFDWRVFLTYIFLLFFVIIIAIYIYWGINRKRTSRSPKKIREVQALRKDDLVSDEEHLLYEKIRPVISKMGALNIRKTKGIIPRISFEFHKDHKYSFLHNLAIEVVSVDDIKISAILRIEYPISLSIKRRTKQDISSEEKKIESSQFFVFHTSHHIAFEEIFAERTFDDLLIKNKDKMYSLTFNSKFIVALLSDFSTIEPLFNLITFIHDELMLKDFGDTAVEELACYQCGDLFQSTEEKCDKCGAPRPSCVVCLLDMKPSEKKKVVQTPCCEVYAHKDHLISWLETNAKCPNCKKDLFLWLRTLKQTRK
ncbi:MAG: E3 ubiquitin protein ligase [Candidatus Heimdallarchaeota archaeon]|nr:E3 ubiquitin protein ligase [Candidatus Heimdallarchaeota archaeon]